ncbi:hypothetical protein SAMD00019534_093350 [Acytostelium subglobosum LB1]|uniref:hypothetical protein n=1 Tax=Acytostelium subglobosum LB1 TaxID=1410327 RepID=UPI000644EABD|nr:hypothetical protein SAMD00019534_093350 [Acytostelium subglobosum LB1]GAM26160.1 hypothetical protein SAMD00019534_093350 [Acytostelium subglobosum LB1]|eukprot:XP_012750714.1 hypothetical protein SAMD00019534_093350 [Acytostelium subglobosum LB1]
MGDVYSISVSDPKMIREIWYKNFESFTDRPIIPSFIYFSGNFLNLVSSKYELWKHNRHIVASAFTKTKLKTIHNVLDSQCLNLITRMSEFAKSGQSFTPSHHLMKYTLNIIMMVLCSEEMSYEDEASGRLAELMEPIKQVFEMIGTGNPADFISVLQPFYLLYLKYGPSRILQRLHFYISEVYHEHLKDIDPENPRDLFDQIIMHEYSGKSEESIIRIAMDFIMAGTDTSGNTLNWLILYMVNNQEIQERAYYELLTNVGKARAATVSDRVNTPYVMAIIKEVLRIKPTGPLGLPRICTQDVEVEGYFIPKDTLMTMNIYAVHHDEEYWDKPSEFIPERFLDNNHTKYWIPFSVGPRDCVGSNLALEEIYIAAANILLNFKLTSSTGKTLDDTEIYGLSIHPNQFSVLLTTR